MTKLLRTVENILSCEVTSLAELARLAGFLPQEMYAGADFEQLDLSEQDVSFLPGIGVSYESCRLTPEQEAFLRKNDRAIEDKSELWRSIATARAQHVRDFIDLIEKHPEQYFDSQKDELLLVLERVLLEPILANSDAAPSMQLGPDYIGETLANLSRLEKTSPKSDFFFKLFEMFGHIQAHGALTTIQVIDHFLGALFDDEIIAEILSHSKPSTTFLQLWITSLPDSSERKKRAFAIAKRIGLKASVVEKLYESFTLTSILELLSISGVEFSRGLEEEILRGLSRNEIRTRHVESVLEGEFHERFKYRVACAGLASGKKEILERCSRFILRSKEGFGGLLLQDAILNTPDFEGARLAGARLLHMNEKRAFRQTIIDTLYERAKTGSQHHAVTNMVSRELPDREGLVLRV